MTMHAICPHCGYARKATDQAPDWQCPACEKAYIKAGSELPPTTFRQYAQPARVQNENRGGRWLLVLAVLAGLFWMGRPFLQSQMSAQTAQGSAQEQPEVILYATDWCGYCKATRRFFEANGIRYTERDIEKSSEALAEHRKLGGNGVPTIRIGNQVIHGYDEHGLRQQLGPWLRR